MPEHSYLAAPRGDDDNPYLTARAPISEGHIVPAGTFAGVCCDVVWIDPATVKSKYPNTRGLVQLRWQLGMRHPQTGSRFVVSRKYTRTLYHGSNLRRHVECWRGSPLTYAEVKWGLDLEAWCLGRPALLLLDRKPRWDDPTQLISVVMAVQPYPVDEPTLTAEDYVRVKDRKRQEGA